MFTSIRQIANSLVTIGKPPHSASHLNRNAVLDEHSNSINLKNQRMKEKKRSNFFDKQF